MKKLQAAIKAAESYGCALDATWCGLDWHVLLWAPPHKIFRSSGCHCDASLPSNGHCERNLDWTDTITAIMDICEDTEDCTEPDCEQCSED